ncbi:FkbM family methyltransferase [Aliarcobacter thereius]|uniref:FkbM family methyltransferase n=1 Tax=Aliarcobacter thereius TaxID=544718 RepID=A0A5R9HAD2_9BACT|nr:FkbM family methyltransferase [Aliarcobacter thereius]
MSYLFIALIFIIKVLTRKEILVFEVNPKTIDFLKINIKLNDVLEIVNTNYLGIGLGDSDGEFTINEPSQKIGGTRLVPKANKEIKTISNKSIVKVNSLDSLNLDIAPNFIKIDVEGMELLVLKGIHKTIHKYKPNIFV